jgi:hypothetical protein
VFISFDSGQHHLQSEWSQNSKAFPGSDSGTATEAPYGSPRQMMTLPRGESEGCVKEQG